jgi:hypothetical protein
MTELNRTYLTGKLSVRTTQGEITEVCFETGDATKTLNTQPGFTFACLATKNRGPEYWYVLGVVEAVENNRVYLAPRFTFFQQVIVTIDEKGIKIGDKDAESLRVFNFSQNTILHAITPAEL